MKILLISPLPPPNGGIATWTKKFIEWMSLSDNVVKVINIAVIGNRALGVPNSRFSIVDEFSRLINVIRNLKKEIKKENPNIVHLNSSCGKTGILRDYLCAIIIKRKKIPLVIQYHCNIEDQLTGSKFAKKIFGKLSKLADTIFVLNSESYNYVLKETGIGTKKVPNFIDNQFLLDDSKQISSELKNILFIGHIHKEKGVLEIIKVAKLLPQIKFILVGPVSDEIKAVDVPENIELTGNMELVKIKELLDKADVFLFPSYSEGFANALLEAMARGLPIITTPVGANEDMIENNGGFIVEVGNISEIIEAIKQIRNPEIRKKMSRWNVNKVKNNYLTDVVISDFIEIYKEFESRG